VAEPMVLSGAAQMPDLICAIAENQDKIAFAAVFEYFAPRLMGFMRQEGFSSEVAEDIASKTMTAV
jgi:RNA polymerase sigma-70 factor, ECF subfamily